MYDRVLKASQKPFCNFGERIVKTENLLSTSAIEGITSRENMTSFMKRLCRSKKKSFSKYVPFRFWGLFFWGGGAYQSTGMKFVLDMALDDVLRRRI